MAVKAIHLTGLSGAGKTSLSRGIHDNFLIKGINSVILDGDIIRRGLSSDLGFSRKDRKENARRVAEIGKILTMQEITCIIALIAPYHEDRELIKEIIGRNIFLEIYVECSIDICIQRDPKSIYKQEQLGLIKDLTGISSDYETPTNPDFTINTDVYSYQESIYKLCNFLDSYY